ncbi:MAG: transporter substrate-binding domain-containing protein [Woeseiaceae bacterium]|nr:transporter substrate-binding domain-containing protein [Woeseiaceae bacterium]
MRFKIVALLLLVLTSVGRADNRALLNEEEQAWLDSLARPITIATEVNYHPYSFINNDGEFDGLVGDYMDLIAERIGVEFESRSFQTFSEVLEAARNREVDIVPGIVAAPERESYLLFTQPAFVTRDFIFTRDDTADIGNVFDLYGRRTGLVAGYARQAQFEDEHPAIDLQLFATEIEGLLALSTGRIDAFVSEIGTSSFYIQQEAITNLRVAGEIEGVDEQTLASRSDWPMLNRILSKALATITAAEREGIERRWVGVGGLDPAELRKVWYRVGVGVLVAFGVIAVMLAWSMSLRSLVASRTSQLQQELEERKKVEAAVNRLAIAVEQSAEYVVVIDAAGVIEYANLAFVEAGGSTDPTGMEFEALAINSTRASLAEGLRKAASLGAWRGIVELTDSSGSVMKVAMTIAPIYDEITELSGYVASGRDVTHEEKLEARLRQSEKLSSLGTLAGGIAHDFNNLLVPILGYADLLRRESGEDVAPYVDGIIDASERARELVRRILIFGRGGSSILEPLDLRFEIGDATPLLESLLPPKVDLSFELESCGAVMCDKTQFQQILVNLCSNAAHAMEREGGIIRVRLEQLELPLGADMSPPDLAPGEYNVLNVSDSGDGMDDETIARIFDPYYSDRPHSQGTGLGLAIVHGVVNAHGGAIQVDSAVDVGTSVRVYLPVVDAEPKRRFVRSKQEMKRGEGERILIIDDDELVLQTVDIMVQALGYTTITWSDPAAALRAYRDAPDIYHAILVDNKMPGMTGLELAEQARRIRPDVPIIVMSGNAEGLREAGVNYIAKPLSLAQLADGLLAEAG